MLMMNDVSVILTDINDVQHSFSEIISFKIIKEYFTPYTSASLKLICSDEFFQYKDLTVKINGFTAHHGLIDTAEYISRSDNTILSISSKSFSSLLLQNQPVPGMIYNTSLNSLMESFIDIPYVTHEDNSQVQNYIFLKDNANLWDAVVNISYKVSGIYPYIRDNNCIRVTLPENPKSIDLQDKCIFSRGIILDYSDIVSDFHMQDIDENYDVYSLHNDDASARNIIRHRQIPLDRQYLSDPYAGMLNRINYSMHGCYAEYTEYEGFCGEDICDKLADGSRIDKIIINGNAAGLKTSLFHYMQ